LVESSPITSGSNSHSGALRICASESHISKRGPETTQWVE
jgi:hypothetical protein